MNPQNETIFLRAEFSYPDFLVEYRGQTSFIKFLESKNLIDTYYCIAHRLLFAIFHSILTEQVIELRKVRTENLKSRIDLREQVVTGWLVIQ